MSKAYPNPFNAEATIFYALTEPAEVTIRIYDILGREIDFIEPGFQQAGGQRVIWNPKNSPSGIYFYKIYAGNNSDVGKAVFIK
jgi:hypothetical protein